MEEWKAIKDFDGYEVSNYGRVRTHNKITYSKLHGERHWQDRILKQKLGAQNEYRIALWRDGCEYYFLVHRLVACAFLGEPENEKMTVNHKDGNRQNNHIDNLEWLSLADNIRHAFNTGLMKNVLNPCLLISENGETINCASFSDASRKLGRNNGYVSNCLKGNKQIKSITGEKFIVRIL